ncbi:MAG TPA: hypothetical protein DEG06_12410 [Lachnospiraceae bacterium]|jgi:transporter family-2 protein|nr:hypothetical protein [Lachnospiraceae bacterium]HCR40549.1 hypothetical protein [Lachnospiraceae bacterium]
MNIFFMILAILAGIFTTIESGINSQLGKHLTPSIATLHSLITGLAFIFLINLIKGNLIRYQKIITVKPILMIGGVFGALIIYLSSKAMPVLGISNTVILVLTGQLVSSLVLDTFINNADIGAKKMTGMILFLIGAILFLQEN